MDALRKNAATIVVGIIVVAAIAAAWVLLGPWSLRNGGGKKVLVHDGDGQTHTLSLDEDATLEVTTSLGTNTVVVEAKNVFISDSDCPKGSCTHQQPISQPGEQLICLPHQLWVEVVSDDDGNRSDTQLDENAVTWDDADEAGDVDLVSR